MIRIKKHGKRDWFMRETDYEGSFDWIEVPLHKINFHPLFTRSELTRIMRDRFPINAYEANLLHYQPKPKTMDALAALWKVYYDVHLRVLIYRVPHFVSSLLRTKLMRSIENMDFVGYAGNLEAKGFVQETNYWTDGVAIFHKELIDSVVDKLPDVVVQANPALIASLRLDVIHTVDRIFLIDDPKFYSPGPVVEVWCNAGTASFYDGRYVDMLMARWYYPGALISRVQGQPYLVFKRGRVVPDYGGHAVLAVTPMDLTEEQVERWKALCGDL